MVEDNLRELT